MSYLGQCSCGKVRYRLNSTPIVTHACHCRQCQRLAGSAFVMNAVIEKDAVELIAGVPVSIQFEGTTHTAHFCAHCGTYVWSAYTGRFDGCWFIRVGTLDDPDAFAPEAHIFTSTKQPWMPIPDGAPRYREGYELAEILNEDSLKRLWAANSRAN